MNFYVDVWWLEDAEKAAAVAWLDEFMALMAPCFNGMTYQNYPRATFKDYPLNDWRIDTYTELVAIKKKYDPGEFRHVSTGDRPLARLPAGTAPLSGAPGLAEARIIPRFFGSASGPHASCSLTLMPANCSQAARRCPG
jgi:hypothetical protein